MLGYSSPVTERGPSDLFMAGATIGAASLIRTGLGWLELWSERVPSLLQVGAEWRDEGAAARTAEGRFRDELIAIARDSSEIAARELRRGLDDLDAFTRPEHTADKPSRPYRAKP